MKQAVRLGEVQETLLVPLYARAMESRRKRPLLVDPKALEMVEAIDWDYRRFEQRMRLWSCIVRTLMFDDWVAQFIRSNPNGTVVEIGAGLNTRFERLDNGRLHWFDLDLPGTIELRRQFFQDTERRKMLTASVSHSEWMTPVLQSPGPYFFVVETVFIYMPEADVKTALRQIAANFPGAGIAFDTGSHRTVHGGNKDMKRHKMAARYVWACDDPRELEAMGFRLVESRAMTDVSAPLRARLSLTARTTMTIVEKLLPKRVRNYLLNLFVARR